MSTENTSQSVLLQPSADSPRDQTPEGNAEITDPVTNAILRWPTDRPLAIVNAGRLEPQAAGPGEPDPRSAESRSTAPRWTILASPTCVTPITALADLDALLADRSTPTNDSRGIRTGTSNETPPFRSGRLLALAYEAGHALEPSLGRHPTRRPTDQPLGYIFECPDSVAFDHAANAWTTPPTGLRESPDPTGYHLGPLASETGADAYCAAVRIALGYIRAGDVYQVNLAHRLTAPFEGKDRALAAALLRTASPAHGFYAELPTDDGRTTAILSASPELFVSFDPATRTVRTSPMKGTRPITGDAEELRAAEKDRAELNMITDLMRNDLGRVCAFGSMRVERARTIEAHGSSVWQATSTVSGTLRDEVSAADLVRAAFPPGSVTGAPKIRAMQIIRELEPVPRGFYCGTLGWLDDDGGFSLNVGIRTATVSADELRYHVGAGIVADSDPDAEWVETLGKADVIARLAAKGGTASR